MSTLSGAVTTLIEGGSRTQLDSALLTKFLMKKLSTRLRSKWGKYVTRLPKGTPPDAVAFRDFIWGVYEQETAGQLVTELTNKTDPPTEPKPAAKTAAEPTTKRSEGGGVHAVADHVSAPPKPLLAIESVSALRPPAQMPMLGLWWVTPLQRLLAIQATGASQKTNVSVTQGVLLWLLA